MIYGVKTTLCVCLLVMLPAGVPPAAGEALLTLSEKGPAALPYYALELHRRFEESDTVFSGTAGGGDTVTAGTVTDATMAAETEMAEIMTDTGEFRYPEINSEEFKLGYGAEPPSIGEQLLYSMGLILLQAGGSRLEAATR